MTVDLEQLRRDYTEGGLRRSDLADHPIDQFQVWMKQAVDAELRDPNAMTVATCGNDGQPTQRIVLLKQVSHDGFVFFTNYGSNKAKAISENSRVSLHFPWHMLERQVKITGRAEKLSKADSFRYFSSRPRDSQLAAWASEQSSPVSSRSLLMQQFARMKEKFSEGEIPLPDFWGGFRVVPDSVEFWQGGGSRLHDRFMYRRDGDGWVIRRLAP